MSAVATAQPLRSGQLQTEIGFYTFHSDIIAKPGPVYRLLGHAAELPKSMASSEPHVASRLFASDALGLL